MGRIRRPGIAICVLVVLAGCLGTLGVPGEDDSAADPPFRFEEVSEEWGFQYTSTNGAVLTRSGGTYVSDVDNDGRPDVLLIGGRYRLPDGFDDYLRVDRGQSILLMNEGDSFGLRYLRRPTDNDERRATGALFFDYDNDGWEDLLVLALGSRPVLFRNHNGTLAPVEGAFADAVTEPRGATTADYDRDGCLDLFVFQEGDWNERLPEGQSAGMVEPGSDNGESNYLYRGDCNGGFERVTDAGIGGTRWSLAASFVDFTGDGWPDIHVANDYNHDYLYVNEGNGTFRSTRLGEATDRNAMSSEVGDVNGDGRPDVFVTNVYFNRSNLTNGFFSDSLGKRFAGRLDGNNLLINRGGGRFTDEADAYGVRKGGWGWAAILADFDNDGDEDLLHTTSAISADMARGLVAPYVTRPAVFERTKAGFRAINSSRIGLLEGSGMGVARLDLDRDGDQDVAMGVHQSERFKLYENRDRDGHWLQVEVRPANDTPAIGSVVTVKTANRTDVEIYQDGSDFLSQDSRVLHFGLGAEGRVEVLRVERPDGTVQTLRDLPANRRIVVTEDGPSVAKPVG